MGDGKKKKKNRTKKLFLLSESVRLNSIYNVGGNMNDQETNLVQAGIKAGIVYTTHTEYAHTNR